MCCRCVADADLRLGLDGNEITPRTRAAPSCVAGAPQSPGFLVVTGRVDILIPPRSRVTVSSCLSRKEYDHVRPRFVACLRACRDARRLPSGSASAANWLEMNFWLSGPRYGGVLPPCDGEWCWARSTPASPRRSVYWASDLTLVSIDRARDRIPPRPANTIPRRYCSGIA